MKSQDYIHFSKFKISSLDADFKSNTRIGALINYFIQSAWQHAEELGWGFKEFGKLDFGWVLSRLKIKLNIIPKWPGEISIETWPKGLNRLFYIRDAEIFDSTESRVASVTSTWLIVDKTTKRPKLYQPNTEMLSMNKNKHAINEEIRTLKLEGKPDYSFEYRVKYTDIDINQHLTTVRYIDYIFDTYDLEFIDNNVPKELTINFLKEIKFGTELTMKRFENKNTHLFELVNKQSNEICFRAEVIY